MPRRRYPNEPAGTCEHCGQPMRWYGCTAADAPGTRVRQAEGICQPCSKQERTNGRTKRRYDGKRCDPQLVAREARWRASYELGRHNRGIDPDGAPLSTLNRTEPQ